MWRCDFPSALLAVGGHGRSTTGSAVCLPAWGAACLLCLLKQPFCPPGHEFMAATGACVGCLHNHVVASWFIVGSINVFGLDCPFFVLALQDSFSFTATSDLTDSSSSFQRGWRWIFSHSWFRLCWRGRGPSEQMGIYYCWAVICSHSDFNFAAFRLNFYERFWSWLKLFVFILKLDWHDGKQTFGLQPDQEKAS